MTVVRGMELGRELTKVMSQLNQFIDVEKKRAKKMGIDPATLRDTNGNLVLAPLYIAKAQTLHALVLVNQRGS
jgi:hypothetical protein